MPSTQTMQLTRQRSPLIGASTTFAALIVGVVALIPAFVLAAFGLLFTVLHLPVEPAVPLVRAAFDFLPMAPALSLLPLLAVSAAVIAIVANGDGSLRSRPGRLARASVLAFVILVAGVATPAFWAVDSLLLH